MERNQMKKNNHHIAFSIITLPTKVLHLQTKACLKKHANRRGEESSLNLFLLFSNRVDR